MTDAFWIQLASGFAGGVVAGLLVYGILALKLFRLQLAVGAVQQALLTSRNKQAAVARWSKEDQLEQELLKFGKGDKSTGDRFANDPMPYGG